MPATDLPLTYTDLVCIDDLDPFASETSSDLQNLSQDVLHLLQELPGTNPDDPDRGVGVETYLSGTLDDLRGLPGKIDAQLSRDDRMTDSATTIQQQANGGFRIDIKIKVSNAIVPLTYGVSTAGGVVAI